MKNDKYRNIDKLENLNKMPVFIMKEAQDSVVPNELTDAQNMFYEYFGANVIYKENNFVHSWPTNVPFMQSPYHDCEIEVPYGRIINCGYDTAGEILRHLYPNIDGSEVMPKETDWMEKGNLIRFDQREFLDTWPF